MRPRTMTKKQIPSEPSQLEKLEKENKILKMENGSAPANLDQKI